MMHDRLTVEEEIFLSNLVSHSLQARPQEA